MGRDAGVETLRHFLVRPVDPRFAHHGPAARMAPRELEFAGQPVSGRKAPCLDAARSSSAIPAARVSAGLSPGVPAEVVSATKPVLRLLHRFQE